MRGRLRVPRPREGPPLHDAVTRTIAQVHERYAQVGDGALADYIPELTQADPRHFGIVVVTADGQQYRVGDVDVPFTIQSVSKAFTYGMALDQHGAAAVEKKVDVEPSGEAFNSISLESSHSPTTHRGPTDPPAPRPCARPCAWTRCCTSGTARSTTSPGPRGSSPGGARPSCSAVAARVASPTSVCTRP